jgi:hypothetical protein
MTMRATCIAALVLCVCGSALRVAAQAARALPGGTTNAAPAAPAATQSPPNTGATAAPTAATPTATDATAGTPEQQRAPAAAAPAAAANAAPAPVAVQPNTEDLRIARERWEMEVMRARARQRARESRVFGDGGDQPPPRRVHGDAGAPFAIGADLESGWYTDRGYDLFSHDDVAPRGGIWGAYDVAMLNPSVVSAIEAGWTMERAADSSLLGGDLATSLRTDAFYAGLQTRWMPVDWVQPHVRLAGGVTRVRISLTAPHDSTRFSDANLAPFGSLGLGFTLRTPTRLFEDHSGGWAALSFGLMFEGGYLLTNALAFDAAGPDRDKRAISLRDARLGKFDRSGPYLRVSVVVRF